MFIRPILVSLAALLVPSYAVAQATGNDYFQARSSQQLSELLSTVERYHLQQGVDKMRSRQYSAAWSDFNFILNYFPNHPRALLLMSDLCGKWQARQCNMDEYFDKALRRSPENAGIHLTKGIHLQKRGKLDEAIDSYKKSLEYNPGSANTHYNLGLAYVAKKEFTLANEHAQQAYSLGISLPGLRDKLVAANAWKPIEAKPSVEPQPTGEAKPEEASK